jgi:predicted nucleic acid-binding protein
VADAPRSPLRIYADTSVFGGCFDARFAPDSRRFFDAVHRGDVKVLLSEVVRRELLGAPPLVRTVLASIPGHALESVVLTDDVLTLRDAYLDAGVVGPGSFDDASHVAAATCARADAIVSWNFKDIVSLGRIQGYNRVNVQLGYGRLTIMTPQGVLRDDDE